MITVRAYFNDLKTQTKLLVGFAVVGFIVLLVGMLGIVGLLRLGNALQTVYTDSTLSLANVAGSSTSLGLYHDAVLEATRAPRRTEFERAVQKLSGLKEVTLADAVFGYFRAAEGAVGCLQDSFSERSSIEGRRLMHDLGQLSASTDVA